LKRVNEFFSGVKVGHFFLIKKKVFKSLLYIRSILKKLNWLRNVEHPSYNKAVLHFWALPIFGVCVLNTVHVIQWLICHLTLFIFLV